MFYEGFDLIMNLNDLGQTERMKKVLQFLGTTDKCGEELILSELGYPYRLPEEEEKEMQDFIFEGRLSQFTAEGLPYCLCQYFLKHKKHLKFMPEIYLYFPGVQTEFMRFLDVIKA